jgi:hypothetical protein
MKDDLVAADLHFVGGYVERLSGALLLASDTAIHSFPGIWSRDHHDPFT